MDKPQKYNHACKNLRKCGIWNQCSYHYHRGGLHLRNQIAPGRTSRLCCERKLAADKISPSYHRVQMAKAQDHRQHGPGRYQERGISIRSAPRHQRPGRFGTNQIRQTGEVCDDGGIIFRRHS